MGTSPRHKALQDHQNGAVLVMVLIFSVLLYVVISQLVTTAKMARLAGENDVLLARMNNHMKDVTLAQIVQLLKDDLDGGDMAEAADGEGGEGGGLAGAMGAAGGAGAEGEEEEEPPSDSSQDAWYKPTAYASGDITTYVWVEDENRKLNILGLVSPDQEFANLTKERVIRLLDSIRENTDYDVSRGDAQTITDGIIEWLEGKNRHEDLRPRPKLKTDDPQHMKTIPLHLDELKLQRGVSEDLFYDKVAEGENGQPMLLPGLESVLTIYTSWRSDPGDPEKQARRGNDPNAAVNEARQSNEPATEEPNADPEGEGIRININTATQPVLRCLFTYGEIPDNVIEAILETRNTALPLDEQEGGDEDDAYQGDVLEGEETKKQIFATLEDLDKIPEVKNLADPKMKQLFLDALTVNSDVFSVHFASLYKRNEKRKVYVLSRRRSILVRLEGDDGARLHPMIHMERRHGLRIFPIDFPEKEREAREIAEMDMDEFAMEEQGWNPFRLEFFKKGDEDE